MTVGSATASPSRVSVADEQLRASETPETGVEGIATIGFGSVLDIARGALGTRTQTPGAEFASPEQMFEPTPESSRDQRGNALRDDYRRDLQADTSTRYDRSSIASRAKLGGNEEPAAPNAAPATPDDKSRSQSEQTRLALNNAKAFSVDPAREAQRTAAPSGVAAGIKDTPPSVAPKIDPTANVAATRGAVPVAMTTESGARDTVAQRVGQVLGASRASGAESSRAIAPVGNAPASPDQKASSRQSGSKDVASQAPRDTRTDRTSSGAEPARTSFDELVRSIRMRGGPVQSTARMHLNPPELGRVRIDVRMDGERMQIDVLTTNDDATKVLTERSADLRMALFEQGISVDRFDVGTDAPSQDDGTLGGRGSEQAPERQAAHDRTGTPPTERDSDEMQTPHSEMVTEHTEVVAERRLDIKV